VERVREGDKVFVMKPLGEEEKRETTTGCSLS